MNNKKVGKVVGVHPILSQVLIQRLNAQEVLGSVLTINDDSVIGAQQAYVLEIGPALPDTVGIKVGDRVVLQGSYIPLPNFDNNPRERGIVEVHAIKGVLVEEAV